MQCSNLRSFTIQCDTCPDPAMRETFHDTLFLFVNALVDQPLPSWGEPSSTAPWGSVYVVAPDEAGPPGCLEVFKPLVSEITPGTPLISSWKCSGAHIHPELTVNRMHICQKRGFSAGRGSRCGTGVVPLNCPPAFPAIIPTRTDPHRVLSHLISKPTAIAVFSSS